MNQELIEWKELITLLKGFREREVSKIRAEMEFIYGMVIAGKMQTSETVLVQYRQEFKNRLHETGILI